MSLARKTKGLGRGLDALLGASLAAEKENAVSEAVQHLPVTALRPGRFQPRTRMDPGALEELAASIRSIRAQGVMQPILVREVSHEQYEIIAGERRWRAAQMAGMVTVPCLVRVVEDEAALALALIENIQREDLNPIEEAQALQRLIDEFGLTHQQAADAVGRSRSAVTNLLRLLELPEPVRELVLAGDLDMGHARALLPLALLAQEQQLALAQQAVARGWSVRETERAVKRLLEAPQRPTKPAKDPDWQRLETRLSERLGAPVRIERRANGRANGQGRLEIGFAAWDELDRLLQRLGLMEDSEDSI